MLRAYKVHVWKTLERNSEMPRITKTTRRAFLQTSLALGAAAAWGAPSSKPSGITRRENRDLFPEGVASGDPDSTSVLLWTRRPYDAQSLPQVLRVEIA